MFTILFCFVAFHFISRVPSLRRFAAMKMRDRHPNEAETSLVASDFLTKKVV